MKIFRILILIFFVLITLVTGCNPVEKAVKKTDGEVSEIKLVGYRCPAEPVKSYFRKGGCRDLTRGKQCLCNGLLATIGLAQSREDGSEAPMLTAGEDFSFATHVIDTSTGVANPSALNYSAKDVIDYLKG